MVEGLRFNQRFHIVYHSITPERERERERGENARNERIPNQRSQSIPMSIHVCLFVCFLVNEISCVFFLVGKERGDIGGRRWKKWKSISSVFCFSFLFYQSRACL